MNRSQIILAAVAAAALAVVVVWIARQWRGMGSGGEQAFFYDVSKGKLFTAPRTAVPPIRGVDGPEEDAFKAVVISVTGRPQDAASRRVAYLEKFSPALKAQMEAAQAGGPPLEISRVEMQRQRFVRRLTDQEWYPLNSPEAERLMSEWLNLGEKGATPTVCVP